MSEWQPIETAPRDGKEVFIWGSAEISPHSRPHIGSEDVERAYWDSQLDTWVVSSAQVDGLYVPAPTHWQPLPEPPK
jgi:hypothetical protein